MPVVCLKQPVTVRTDFVLPQVSKRLDDVGRHAGILRDIVAVSRDVRLTIATMIVARVNVEIDFNLADAVRELCLVGVPPKEGTEPTGVLILLCFSGHVVPLHAVNR